jgi:hypothetical protein
LIGADQKAKNLDQKYTKEQVKESGKQHVPKSGGLHCFKEIRLAVVRGRKEYTGSGDDFEDAADKVVNDLDDLKVVSMLK